MNDINSISDVVIQQRIGSKLRSIRLRENITQKNLAESAEVSLSTIKKIEGGEIRSFDALLRVLRILGKLDVFQSLVDEELLSPGEYYQLVHSANTKIRKRAVTQKNIQTNKKEESEW